MTKILSVNEVSMQTVIALTRDSDKIVLKKRQTDCENYAELRNLNRNRAFWVWEKAKDIL